MIVRQYMCPHCRMTFIEEVNCRYHVERTEEWLEHYESDYRGRIVYRHEYISGEHGNYLIRVDGCTPCERRISGQGVNFDVKGGLFLRFSPWFQLSDKSLEVVSEDQASEILRDALGSIHAVAMKKLNGGGPQ